MGAPCMVQGLVSRPPKPCQSGRYQSILQVDLQQRGWGGDKRTSRAQSWCGAPPAIDPPMSSGLELCELDGTSLKSLAGWAWTRLHNACQASGSARLRHACRVQMYAKCELRRRPSRCPELAVRRDDESSSEDGAATMSVRTSGRRMRTCNRLCGAAPVPSASRATMQQKFIKHALHTITAAHPSASLQLQASPKLTADAPPRPSSSPTDGALLRSNWRHRAQSEHTGANVEHPSQYIDLC